MDAITLHHSVISVHAILAQHRPHARSIPGRIKQQLQPDRDQEDIVDCAIWGGAIIPLLFLIQYTWLSGKKLKWWRVPAGRAIVALDICLLAVFIPSAITLSDPAVIFGQWHEWLTIIALLAVPAVVLYRMISLEYGRRLRKHEVKGVIDDDTGQDREEVR